MRFQLVKRLHFLEGNGQANQATLVLLTLLDISELTERGFTLPPKEESKVWKTLALFSPMIGKDWPKPFQSLERVPIFAMRAWIDIVGQIRWCCKIQDGKRIMYDGNVI